jgi:hypothetical protein
MKWMVSVVAALYSSHAAVAAAVDRSDFSAHRWCYLQMQDQFIHSMILAADGSMTTERYDANKTRFATYQGRWKVDTNSVMTLTFRQDFRASVEMEGDKERFTFTTIGQSPAQTITLIACDKEIPAAQSLPLAKSN